MAGSPRRCVVVGHATIDEISLWQDPEPVEVLGGAAIYATCGALAAGAHVALVTCTGSDYDFSALTASAELARGGLELFAEKRDDSPSIRNRCHYQGPDERRWEVVNWTTMLDMSPGWSSVEPVLDRCSALVVCPTPVPVAFELVRRARSICPAVVCDTEVHYLTDPSHRALLLEAARGDVYFAPSWVHVDVLFGQAFHPAGQDLTWLLGRCRELRLSHLVVKRGEMGSVVLDVGRSEWAVVPPVMGAQVVDPTGAGDAFDGGFAVTLAATGDPVEAACWGSVSASFTIEHRGGTLPAHYSPSAAIERLVDVKERVGLVHCPGGGVPTNSKRAERRTT